MRRDGTSRAGPATGRCPWVSLLSSSERTGHRDPAARSLAVAPSPKAVSLLARRATQDHGCRGAFRTEWVSSPTHLSKARRSAGQYWASNRGGCSANDGRRAPGRRAADASYPQHQVSEKPPGSSPSDDGVGATRVRPRARTSQIRGHDRRLPCLRDWHLAQVIDCRSDLSTVTRSARNPSHGWKSPPDASLVHSKLLHLGMLRAHGVSVAVLAPSG